MNQWIECPRCKHYGAYTKTASGYGASSDLIYECECVICGHEFKTPYTPKFILRHVMEENAKKYREIIKDGLNKKEELTMQVSYNGFTGELVKLEYKHRTYNARTGEDFASYDLSIYDSEKQVTHSFTGVKLEDVKFLGGAVSFGG